MERSAKGFTLAELLVTIGILAVLAGVLLPVLARTRERDRLVRCKSSHKCIGLAMNMYSNDYDEFYPTMGVDVVPISATEGRNQRTLASLSLLFDQYHSALMCFRCPSTNDDPRGLIVGQSFTPSQCSFAYDSQKGVLTNPGVAIMADKPASKNGWSRNSGNHYNQGQHVLFYDGHVEWSPRVTAGLNGDNIYSFRSPGVPVAITDSFITQN